MLWNRGMINIDGVPTEACRSFERVLSTKIRKLRDITLPKILLVRDLSGLRDYGLIDPDVRSQCAASLSELLDKFQAVFVTQDDEYGFPFHPPESEWSRSLFQ